MDSRLSAFNSGLTKLTVPPRTYTETQTSSPRTPHSSTYSPSKPPRSKGSPINPQNTEKASARIIQSNLIYVINLPQSAADESILRSKEYFGQYGRINKCSLNKGFIFTNSSNTPAYGAHITFSTDEEAALCIKACHNYELDGKPLTVTYGTTKYCNFFLSGQVCPKKDCLYLHKEAPQTDTVLREHMPSKHIQGHDAVIDKIRVVVQPPNQPYKLPSARVVRERAASEIIPTMPSQSRIRSYSKEFNLHSLVNLVDEGDESPPEVPQIFNKLRQIASPCKDLVEVSTEDIEEIMSPSSPDKWAADVLEFLPGSKDEEKVLVSSKIRIN
ncbi:unnamed protein product [Blepharisma stoltei]|uniref:RRM domain-containing protein n=1 Tax=Blepharisma stoltei TaxID=1481888 RepID=A0AAU9IGG1_9CILI|nr:unnamed protein product [Blepharisma stoltei]